MTPPDTRVAALVRAFRETGSLDDDLSLRQVAVLALSTLPVPGMRTVRGMAEALGVYRPAVSRAADRLQILGLLRRVPDRHDLRSIFLEATPSGRARAAALLNLPQGEPVRAAASAVLAAWQNPAARDRNIIAALDEPMATLAAALGDQPAAAAGADA